MNSCEIILNENILLHKLKSIKFKNKPSKNDFNNNKNKNNENNFLISYLNFDDLNYTPIGDSKLVFDYLSKKETENLINLLVKKSSFQLQKIKEFYNKNYFKPNDKNFLELTEKIKNLYNNDFYLTIKILFENPFVFNCNEIKTLDIKKIINIIITSSNSQIKLLKIYFKYLNNINLLDFIKNNLKDEIGLIKEILLFLIEKGRNSNSFINYLNCNKIIKYFINKCTNNDDYLNENREIMIDFLAKSSKNDLNYIKKTIENNINSTLIKKHFNNFNNNEIYLIETIFNFFENKYYYYAQQIYTSTKGLGTNDEQLIKNVINIHNLKISDLVKINFLKITKNESLLENIKDDTSGDYYKLLKALIEN